MINKASLHFLFCHLYFTLFALVHTIGQKLIQHHYLGVTFGIDIIGLSPFTADSFTTYRVSQLRTWINRLRRLDKLCASLRH
jgi:hypothetical protein